MRAPFIAALAALGMAACNQPEATVDEPAPTAADHVATNTDADADAAAIAAAADASSVTSVDRSVGP